MDCYFFKVVCVGDSGVGKTYFMEMLKKPTKKQQGTKSKTHTAQNRSPSLTSIPETIGMQFHSKMFLLDESIRVKIHFWDLSGQKRFRDIIEPYYIMGDAILLFFDTSSVQSFESCSEWIELVSSNLQDESYQPFFILIGVVKKHKKRMIRKNVAIEFANEYDMIYLEFDHTINSMYKICDVLSRELIYIRERIIQFRRQNILLCIDDETNHNNITEHRKRSISQDTDITHTNTMSGEYDKALKESASNSSLQRLLFNDAFHSASSTSSSRHSIRSIDDVDHGHERRTCSFICDLFCKEEE